MTAIVITENQLSFNDPLVLLVDLSTSVNAAWYGLGYLRSTGGGDASQTKLWAEVKDALSTSSIDLVSADFTVTTNENAAVKGYYEITTGAISALNPRFAAYYESSTGYVYIYAQIPANTYVQIGVNRRCGNYFHELSTYEGTGSSPAGASGKTLKYDVAVDDAGLFAPKTVAFSGPFASSPQNASVYFSIHSNTCVMTISQLITTGNGGSGLITAPAGTIADKWLPYGKTGSNMPSFPVYINNGGVQSWGKCAINTSLDGGFTISTESGGSFSPGSSGCGFYNISFPWVINNT